MTPKGWYRFSDKIMPKLTPPETIEHRTAQEAHDALAHRERTGCLDLRLWCDEQPARFHRASDDRARLEQRVLGLLRHETSEDFRRCGEDLRHDVRNVLVGQHRPFRHAAHVRGTQ